MLRELKTIIYSSALLIGVFSLSFFLLNLFYKYIVLNETVLYRAELQFIEQGLDAKPVFMGDSHSQADIDPALFDDSFNYASSAESYFFTFHKLNFLLNKSSKLESLVLPIDLHTFSPRWANTVSDYWFWSDYVSYQDLSEWKEDLSYLNFLFMKNFPLLGNGNLFLENMLVDSREVVSGHVLDFSLIDFAELDEEGRRDQAKFRVDKHFDHSEIVFNEDLHDYFVKTVDLALDSDIDLVLLKFPISREYFDYLNANYIEDIELFEENLLSPIDLERVKILDYRNVFFENPEYFSDPDHLNERGIEVFMSLLKEDLADSVEGL